MYISSFLHVQHLAKRTEDKINNSTLANADTAIMITRYSRSNQLVPAVDGVFVKVVTEVGAMPAQKKKNNNNKFFNYNKTHMCVNNLAYVEYGTHLPV